MNRGGYAVTCNKCGSSNVEYEYKKTMFNECSKKNNTPVKCNACKFQTEMKSIN